jgi:hypothetical protein
MKTELNTHVTVEAENSKVTNQSRLDDSLRHLDAETENGQQSTSPNEAMLIELGGELFAHWNV